MKKKNQQKKPKKETEMEKEREELGWIKDFKVESRDKKIC